MTLAVTGGSLRGRRLRPPRDRAVRPTAARVREALFSILGQNLDGHRVLDMFAGTGTIGIEAASRGASEVVFVENNRAHLSLLRENAALLEGVAEFQVVPRDACKAVAALARQGRCFDFAFLDPPYGAGLASACLEALAPVTGSLLSRTAVLAAETDGREELPGEVGDWCLVDNRNYGQTALAFYRHREALT